MGSRDQSRLSRIQLLDVPRMRISEFATQMKGHRHLKLAKFENLNIFCVEGVVNGQSNNDTGSMDSIILKFGH